MNDIDKDIDKVEYKKLLHLDWIDLQHLLPPETEHKAGDLIGFWCGFGKHLIVQHYWNTGNRQTLKMDANGIIYTINDNQQNDEGLKEFRKPIVVQQQEARKRGDGKIND